jgi:hypothetical protein
MDYSEAVAELEGFVGKAVWVGVFASDSGQRFPLLTCGGRLQKAGPVNPATARAVRALGSPDNVAFALDEPRIHLTLWANLLVGAEWVEVAGAPRLRLSFREGTGIDIAEFLEEEADAWETGAGAT